MEPGLTFGPSGNLYVVNDNPFNSSVLEFNGTTGAYLETFVSTGGALGYADFLTFGPNGNLYVADALNNQVLEYNGTTGAFLTTFVTTGSGGLSSPEGIVFGPNGNLFVASLYNNQVLEYNGATGAFSEASWHREAADWNSRTA